MNDGARARKKAWEHRFIGAGVALAVLSVLILFVGPKRRPTASRPRP
jgi:hypothetical protein